MVRSRSCAPSFVASSKPPLATHVCNHRRTYCIPSARRLHRARELPQRRRRSSSVRVQSCSKHAPKISWRKLKSPIRPCTFRPIHLDPPVNTVCVTRVLGLRAPGPLHLNAAGETTPILAPQLSAAPVRRCPPRRRPGTTRLWDGLGRPCAPAGGAPTPDSHVTWRFAGTRVANPKLPGRESP
jgi:hypothetical protein